MVTEYRTQKASAVLSLMPIDLAQASKTGVVVWEAPFVRRIVEKPRPEEAPSNISSLPLYIFAPHLLDLLPLVQPSARGEYELQDAIQLLIERTGQVMGVLASERQQVTNAADLLALNLHYLDTMAGEVRCESPLPGDIELRAPVVIEAGVEIAPGCVIGPRVYIEQDARIGLGAQLVDTLVLRGAEVIAGQRITGEVIAPLPAYAPKANP
jgi:NDP-sugar pyrophosphorylase family protein